MFDQQERELKMMLTEAEYSELLKSYEFQKPVIQTNTYYDTEDEQLKNEKSALRIRKIGNENILTVKKPKDSITKYEYEFPLSENSDSIEHLNPQEREKLNQIIHLHSSVSPTVTFTTKRNNLILPDAVLSLDETNFANHTDYELEYEYTADHDGIKVLNQLLEPIHRTYEKNGPNKLARAMMDRLDSKSE